MTDDVSCMGIQYGNTDDRCLGFNSALQSLDLHNLHVDQEKHRDDAEEGSKLDCQVG